MARIRTVKPEFWDSPGVETLNPYWRLLFIAMWNWADDSGRGKAEARELMGFAFPRDEDMTLGEFRRGLGEVRRVFGVKFYRVDGRSYFSIPSWSKHQKIDKRSDPRWPAPEQGEEYDPSTGESVSPQVKINSGEPAEDAPNSRSVPGAGTGEQGNRGSEEKTCPAALPLNVPAPQPPTSRRTASRGGDPPGFAEFWATYPRRENRGAAVKAFAKALKRVSAEEITAGAQRYATDPNRKSDFTAHASTWLNGERWTDEPMQGQRRADDIGESAEEMAARLTRQHQETVS